MSRDEPAAWTSKRALGMPHCAAISDALDVDQNAPDRTIRES
jgi:hypothetical protein